MPRISLAPRARARWRPPFSLALIGLVVLVTAATGAILGFVGWRDKLAGSRILVARAMTQTSRLTVEHTASLLRHAEVAARQGPTFVRQGLLDPADLRALDRYTLAVLRGHADFTGVGYVDRSDGFVGARRDLAGEVFVNRGVSVEGRIRLEEERVHPDGRRERVSSSDDPEYRPTELAFYRTAKSRGDLAWTGPYRFLDGSLGITCAMPLLDDDGTVRGVFTVDFSVDELTGFLESLEVSPRGHVFVTTRDGQIVAGPRGAPRSERAALLREILGAADVPAGEQTLVRGGERYLVRTQELALGDLRWFVTVVLPARDYTEPIDAQTWHTVGLGLGVLVVAAGLGMLLARWVAMPLRELAVQARRVRHGDFGAALAVRSRDEIGSLARTMAEMVEGLRQRDFIRDVLGRYVSPEVAERCLRDPEALRLGGELRSVTILMSDLRGFSALSERLGPEVMIRLVNRYFGHMTPVILAHGGYVNEFIGDAILALFGAPVAHVDDEARAVRCAWAMQQAMTVLNAESRQAALPELAMGIALHRGSVVAGNIGSEDRVKYGVLGPAVNLTSRLESLAAGSQVLLSAALYERVASLVRVGPPRRLRIKGSEAPVTVYELLGLVAEAEGPAPAASPP
jgi:sigma-B regulation protein RsbU (phosphoserine phosphatase)